MRVVIDTNLWVSGLMIPTSVPGRIVQAVARAEIVAVLSEPLWNELSAALHYRKLRARIALNDEELGRYLSELRYVAEMVDIAHAPAHVPRDRNDDTVLATYLASGADYLLTGDADLLALHPPHSILTAREFYEQHLR
jgi:putative PIN family toxin of toxin-antitoxin system